MQRSFLLAICLMCTMMSSSQVPGALQVGDKMPDILLNDLHNYKTANAKISDLRDKLLILDFWATWCGSCVAGIPKMEALQKKYPDKLKIILVNSTAGNDTEEKIRATFDKLKYQSGNELLLTNMRENKELGFLFPRTSIPHYVWIDKAGKVVAITSSQEVTAENVSKVIEDKPVTMTMKLDQVQFDTNTPLLVNENGGNEADFMFRSLLTGYNNRINGGGGHNRYPKQGPHKIYQFNRAIGEMLRYGYQTMEVNKRRWVFAGKDSIALKEKVLNPEHKYEHLYCYELITPPSDFDTKRRCMREDLKRYFNISVSQEKRTLPCIAITKVPQHMPLPADTNKVIRIKSAAALVKLLNAVQSVPFIDSTGTQALTEIILPEDVINDPAKLRSYLVDAGFSITDILQEYNVSVITDN